MTPADEGSGAASDGSGSDDTEELTGRPEAAERSSPVADGPVPHSAFVGFMSVPISRRVPIRRSTALMAVAFLGFGTLFELYPPDSTPSAQTPQPVTVVPGIVPATTSTTTTTSPPSTTTTTRPRSSTTTTSPFSSTTTTRPFSSTTTTGPPGSTTSTVAGSTTTTTTRSVGSTTSTSLGSTASTTSAP